MDAFSTPVSIQSVEVPLADILASDCDFLYAYWNDLRGDRFAPRWDEFHLIELPAPLIPFLYVVDVLHDPFDLRFRFWGTGLTTVFKRDHTGQSLSNTDLGIISEERRIRIMDDNRAVVDRRAPFPFLWDTRTAGRSRMAAPAIRLPLSDDGEAVTNIVCGFDFTDKHYSWTRLLEPSRPVP